MYRIKLPTLSSPNMLLRPRNSGASEREDGGNGTGSDSGNVDGHNRIAANGNQFTNSTGTPGSTSLRSSGRPNSGLRSLIGSRDGSSPFPPTPPVDTRQQYKGSPFVFETDAYHCTETIYGNESGDCIRYLKPIHRVRRTDSLPPIRLPYFFTGFSWRDVDGQQCSMSRVELCDAWQTAFNRLLYYASFLEERPVKLDAPDIELFKQEFTIWNDLFIDYTLNGELDQTLGRLVHCEVAHVLPKFKASMALEDLTNPKTSTDSKTPFRDWNSTFSCAAREVLEKHARENESPPDHIKEIERNTEGWVPCTGYSVVRATDWGGDELETEKDILTQGGSAGAV